jgi:hypothetical protein
MARKSSRRRRTRRNPKYVVANKRRRSRKMRHNRVHRLMKNLLGGTDLMRDVLTPVLGATAGFVAARYLGNVMADKNVVTTDPRVAKSIAAGVGIPLTFFAASKVSLVAKNSGAIVTGMGLAAAEAWIRDTKLLGGSPAAAVVVESAPAAPEAGDHTVPASGDGLASYYAYPTNRAGQARSGLASYYDYPTNRAGQARSGMGDDYYTATMLSGADPADQSEVEGALDDMEGETAVSTIIPTDLAMEAQSMPQFARVSQPFAGGRGYAGGIFSRNLFSGTADP